MTTVDIILVLVALAFAWSMGAHYTGACMGMPYATRSIGLRWRLVDDGAAHADRRRLPQP